MLEAFLATQKQPSVTAEKKLIISESFSEQAD